MKKIQKNKDKEAAEQEEVFTYKKQPKGELGAAFKIEPTRYEDWEIKGRCSDF